MKQTKELTERVSHATSKKVEFYVIVFDNKEFKVKVINSQRHHKDYPEITNVEVNQTPSFEDRKRINEILKKELAPETFAQLEEFKRIKKKFDLKW